MPPAACRFPSRTEIRVAAFVAFATFVVYAATAYPDVPGGDSGELIGALASGGVIHPPGYPLYALLARLFLLIPHGTIAWRANLFSAVCAALAAGVLFVAVARWSGSRAGGGSGGRALRLRAPIVWLYAISAEVFALNDLFVALLLLFAVLYREGGERRFAYAGALTSGLALANHHTVLFVVAPLAIWMLWLGRGDLLRVRPLVTLLSLACLGLVPYVALLFARRDAVVSWGVTDTWDGFWTHVLRRDYGPLHLASAARARAGGDPAGTIGAWFQDLVRELGWWSGALLVGGLVLSVRDDTKRLGLALVAVLALCVGVFALLWGLPSSDALHREILARFWQEPLLVCAAWCGWAVAALERRLARGDGAPRARRFAVPAITGALVLAPLAVHAKELNHHASRIVHDYGAEILRAAPPGALLLTKGDLITNATRYLQLAEGMRPDVVVVDQELLGFEWYGKQIAARYPDVHLPGRRYMPGAADGFFMKQLLDANADRSTILICGGVKEGDLTADTTYGLWPHGLCDLVHRGSEPVNVEGWIRDSEAALPKIAFGEEARPPGSWESIAWGDDWAVRERRGLHLMALAGADPARRAYLASAAAIFQDLVATEPDPPPQLYKDLAQAIGRQGLASPEDRARAAEAWRRYLRVAPVDDPQRPGIEKELARLSAG